MSEEDNRTASGGTELHSSEPNQADQPESSDQHTGESAHSDTKKSSQGKHASSDPENDSDGEGQPDAPEIQTEEADFEDTLPRHAKAETDDEAGKSKKWNKRTIAILVVALVVLVGIVVWGCVSMYQQYLDQKREEEERAAIQMPEPPQDNEYIADNPIDFATLTAEHPDLYAWLAYPATGINLPIFQEPVQSDEDLYLRHDMNGEYSLYGELYTQKYNTKTFEDPVTVIYGHTFPDTDLMFTPLHLLEDVDFFRENQEFQIYIPQKILTYEVIAVAETDNSLILSSHEFGNREVLQAYYDDILHPTDGIAYVRDGVTLDAETDRIVQLSTCTIPSDPAHRYLVTAKLTGEQKTH